jgi:4,5-DOPA dioxygenase extradiol
MPVVFLAHGAPPLLDDRAWLTELARWGQAMPKPKALLVLSAHWEARPATIGATKTAPLVYDFSGFPERYYAMTYAAPGAPELAARVRDLLRAAKLDVADDPARGLDHGAWVPLTAMYPAADVPTLQLSLPSLDAKELFALGRALAPLSGEGVLVMGSGFLTHNMRALGSASTPAWASEFDAWIAETLARGDHDALLDWMARAPGAALAHPRTEHFAPVVAAAGAADLARGGVRFPIEGYWGMAPAFSRRSVQFG